MALPEEFLPMFGRLLCGQARRGFRRRLRFCRFVVWSISTFENERIVVILCGANTDLTQLELVTRETTARQDEKY